MNTNLHIKTSASDRRAEKIVNMTPLDQVERALRVKTFKQGAALVLGAVVGGMIPVLTYRLAHDYVASNPALWMGVAAGLSYSATTVYQWAKAAFKYPAKAIGFVILMEGYMTLVPDHIGGTACLVLLAFINACSAACWLSLNKRGSDLE